MMAPELDRKLPLARIPRTGLTETVTASAAECAALAARFALPEIRSLTCRFRLDPLPGGAIAAAGALRAELVQICVASLDPFPVTIAEDFAVRFVPTGRESDDPDPDAVDEIAFAGTVLELGEAAAEQLALALDPYPRKPDPAPEATAAPPHRSPFTALRGPRRPS